MKRTILLVVGILRRRGLLASRSRSGRELAAHVGGLQRCLHGLPQGGIGSRSAHTLKVRHKLPQSGSFARRLGHRLDRSEQRDIVLVAVRVRLLQHRLLSEPKWWNKTLVSQRRQQNNYHDVIAIFADAQFTFAVFVFADGMASEQTWSFSVSRAKRSTASVRSRLVWL